MIAGETEAIVSEQIGEDTYDNFLFGRRNKARSKTASLRKTKRINNRLFRKNKRVARRNARIIRKTARRNSPTRVMRRERTKSFIQDLGAAYRNSGAATGIGNSIDSLSSQLDPNFSGNDNTKSDFQVSLGKSDANNKTSEKKQGIPTMAYIIGGVALLGIVGAIAMKKNSAPVYPPIN